jgi:hypothetical protein
MITGRFMFIPVTGGNRPTRVGLGKAVPKLADPFQTLRDSPLRPNLNIVRTRAEGSAPGLFAVSDHGTGVRRRLEVESPILRESFAMASPSARIPNDLA